MVICEALGITPEELLIGKQADKRQETDALLYSDDMDIAILNECKELPEEKKRRLLAYVSMLRNSK